MGQQHLIDPALLTLAEYEHVVNEKGKFHPSSAYETSLKDLSADYLAIRRFTIPVQTIKSRGLTFQVRLRQEPSQYVKVDANKQPVQLNGQTQCYSADEMKQLGLKPYEETLGIFNDKKQCVGAVQDEWGCVLIRVAHEYSGFGFGVILGKIARRMEPAKPSGGFTPQGRSNFVKVHREFVRDALTAGLYRSLLQSGQIKIDRVKEIVASARLTNKAPVGSDVGTNDPRNWAFYGDSGCFAIYDKKLKTFVEEENDRWYESAIKGYILVRIPNETGVVVHMGGDNDRIKTFLLNCGSAFCAQEGVDFRIDDEDQQYIDQQRMHIVGKQRDFTRTKAVDPLDIDNLVIPERRWRRSFDRYDEFFNRMLELAEAKYRL